MQPTDELIRQCFVIDRTVPAGLRWIHHPNKAFVNRTVNSTIQTMSKDGYYYMRLQRTYLLAHRVVFFLHNGYWPNQCDHWDGDRTNNAPDNLRDVDRLANSQNRRARGYSYVKATGKYVVAFNVNKVRHHIGFYDTPEEAKAAYVEAKRKIGNISERVLTL